MPTVAAPTGRHRTFTSRPLDICPHGSGFGLDHPQPPVQSLQEYLAPKLNDERPDARAVSPNECAAQACWDQNRQGWVPSGGIGAQITHNASPSAAGREAGVRSARRGERKRVRQGPVDSVTGPPYRRRVTRVRWGAVMLNRRALLCGTLAAALAYPVAADAQQAGSARRVGLVGPPRNLDSQRFSAR